MQKCILIYEDDLEILELCKAILSVFGHRVATRTRCEHIIQDIAEFRPDAVLMDLWIPEIGGEQAVTLLRAAPETRNMPVILFSANDEIEAISQKVNANAYLKKPFDIDHFKQIVEQVLS
jgi:two-component system cell cycle response regulator DivK